MVQKSSLQKVQVGVRDAHAMVKLAVTSMDRQENRDEVMLILHMAEAILEASKKDVQAAMQEADQ
jgi:hypothetical protein